MDLTFHIIVVKTPRPEYTAEEQHRLGDIIDVYRTSDVTEPHNVDSPLAFVHVTGVPVSVALKIKSILGSDVDGQRHTWRFRLSAVPAGKIDDLTNTRETTSTWTQAKSYIQRYSDNAPLTDGDV
jgi:hypothetical protein